MLLHLIYFNLIAGATVQSLEDLDCRDFSVAKCDTNPNSILEIQTIPGIGDFKVAVDICQKICISKAGCNYMSYDHATSECLLMNHDIHNGYLSSCDLIAGPTSPTLVQCDELDTDSCQLLVRENCEYTGKVVYSSKDVLTAAECQILMQGIGIAFGAELWIHDTPSDNLCEFRATKDAVCSAVNGPPEPSYLNCGATTTQMPTTVTTTQMPTTVTTTPAPTTTTTRPPTTTFYFDSIILNFTTLNALDNSKLPNVSVSVYGETGRVYTFETDETGFYSLVMNETVYQGNTIGYNCSKEGFLRASNQFNVVDSSSNTILVSQALTPNLSPNQRYRVVMAWGTHPEDLDLHVTEFAEDGTDCDTYYSNMNGCDGLSLDVDNTHGGDAGAETITWTQDLDGYSFLIFVVDYSRDSSYPFKASQVGDNISI